MIFCNNCGSQGDSNTKFCANCGSSLEMTFNTTQAPPTAPFQPQQPVQPVPPPLPQQPPFQAAPQVPQQPFQASPPSLPQQPPFQAPQPIAPPFPQQPGVPQYQQPLKAERDFNKLGGWLLLFIIGNIIWILANAAILTIGIIEAISDYEVLSGLGDLKNLLPESLETAFYIMLAGMAIGLLTIIFTAISVINVFRRKPPFLLIWQISVFAGMLYAALVGIVPHILLGLFDLIFVINICFVAVCIIVLILLTLYISKSIRVRTFMGCDDYMKKAVFAFKNQLPLNRPSE